MNLRYLILHNFWLKLISLGLASLIWLAVHYQVQSEHAQNKANLNRMVSKQFRNVPVSIVTMPGDQRVFRISPREATAIVVGEEDSLNKMAAKNLTLYVDLTDFHSPRSTNEELHAHTPADVSIIGIQPTTIQVEQISP